MTTLYYTPDLVWCILHNRREGLTKSLETKTVHEIRNNSTYLRIIL